MIFCLVGETTNLMQIDTQKFLDLSLYLNLVWTSPLQIVLAMYFLWNILGPSSLAGRRRPFYYLWPSYHHPLANLHKLHWHTYTCSRRFPCADDEQHQTN